MKKGFLLAICLCFLAFLLPEKTLAAQNIPMGEVFTVNESTVYTLTVPDNREYSFRRISGGSELGVYIDRNGQDFGTMFNRLVFSGEAGDVFTFHFYDGTQGRYILEGVDWLDSVKPEWEYYTGSTGERIHVPLYVYPSNAVRYVPSEVTFSDPEVAYWDGSNDSGVYLRLNKPGKTRVDMTIYGGNIRTASITLEVMPFPEIKLGETKELEMKRGEKLQFSFLAEEEDIYVLRNENQDENLTLQVTGGTPYSTGGVQYPNFYTFISNAGNYSQLEITAKEAGTYRVTVEKEREPTSYFFRMGYSGKVYVGELAHFELDADIPLLVVTGWECSDNTILDLNENVVGHSNYGEVLKEGTVTIAVKLYDGTKVELELEAVQPSAIVQEEICHVDGNAYYLFTPQTTGQYVLNSRSNTSVRKGEEYLLPDKWVQQEMGYVSGVYTLQAGETYGINVHHMIETTLQVLPYVPGTYRLETPPAIYVGECMSFAAVPDGFVDATDMQWTFTTSDEAVILLEEPEKYIVRFRACAPGTAEITGISENGDVVTCTVEVLTGEETEDTPNSSPEGDFHEAAAIKRSGLPTGIVVIALLCLAMLLFVLAIRILRIFQRRR